MYSIRLTLTDGSNEEKVLFSSETGEDSLIAGLAQSYDVLSDYYVIKAEKRGDYEEVDIGGE